MINLSSFLSLYLVYINTDEYLIHSFCYRQLELGVIICKSVQLQ